MVVMIAFGLFLSFFVLLQSVSMMTILFMQKYPSLCHWKTFPYRTMLSNIGSTM